MAGAFPHMPGVNQRIVEAERAEAAAQHALRILQGKEGAWEAELHAAQTRNVQLLSEVSCSQCSLGKNVLVQLASNSKSKHLYTHSRSLHQLATMVAQAGLDNNARVDTSWLHLAACCCKPAMASVFQAVPHVTSCVQCYVQCCLAVSLLVCLSICWSVCLSVCLSGCLSLCVHMSAPDWCTPAWCCRLPLL